MRLAIGQQNILRVRHLPVKMTDRNTVVFQQLLDEQRQRAVINRQPAAFFRQAINIRRRRILYAIKRDTNSEAAAHTRLGFNGNIAIHHADKLFTNRQTESGPLEIALHAGPYLEERVKQAYDLFRRDPFPGIAHADAQIILRPLYVQDNAAGIGKLNRVTQQV